jgi:hypothetical protein
MHVHRRDSPRRPTERTRVKSMQQLGLGWGKGRRVVLTIVPRRPETLRMAKAWLRPQGKVA